MSLTSEAYRGARNEYDENCARRKKIMPFVKNELLNQLEARGGTVKTTSFRELMQLVKEHVQIMLRAEDVSVYDEDVQEAFYRLAEEGLITFGKTIEITQTGRD